MVFQAPAIVTHLQRDGGKFSVARELNGGFGCICMTADIG